MCTFCNDSLYLVNPILDALNRCYLRFPACSSENLPVRWRLGLKLLCIGGLQEHVMIHNRERPLLLISLQSCSPNEPEFTTRKFKDIMRVYRTYVIEWEKQSAVHIALTSFPSLHTACSFDILRNLMSTAVSLSLYICGNLWVQIWPQRLESRYFLKIYINLYLL